MANIRKRGKSWQAQIRSKNQNAISKTFRLKAEAIQWAREVESGIERRTYVDHTIAEHTTLSCVLERYKQEVLPSLRGKQSEQYRIDKLSEYFNNISLAQLSSLDLARFRDIRLKSVGSESVRRELGIINRVLVQAHHEWGITLPRGIPTVKKPKPPSGRQRRLVDEEEQSLLSALEHAPLVRAMVILAIETAMRRGEIISINWTHINFRKRLLDIPVTKTNIPRTIPLTSCALSVLKSLPVQIDGTLFPVKPNSVSQSFRRACKRAKLNDLHFHDLRHEATSRFFEMGLSIMEVAAITGHKDLSMLQRYTHLKPEDILKKLA